MNESIPPPAFLAFAEAAAVLAGDPAKARYGAAKLAALIRAGKIVTIYENDAGSYCHLVWADALAARSGKRPLRAGA